jgi:Tetratricopeptide repeat
MILRSPSSATMPDRVLRATALLLIVGAFFGAFFGPATALADDHAKVEARAEVEKAQLHYKLGRFEEALQSYARAYELFSAPALLFNIGQCHKKLKNFERAIFFFEGYLREESNPDKRVLAEELIAGSRADLEKQRLSPPGLSAKALAPVARSPALSNGSTDSDVGLPPSLTLAPGGDSSPGDPGARPPAAPASKKWWFWTAIGVGVFALAGGAFAVFESGRTTTVLPSGSVGTLDRR